MDIVFVAGTLSWVNVPLRGNIEQDGGEGKGMRIAVLIPCFNEELTVGKVIRDFRRELPDSVIYVYDNNSADKTFEVALANGAVVRREYRQGKGNVISSMFRDVEADIYILVDGDDTYPAEDVHRLIRPIVNQEADMVIGDRHANGAYQRENKRPFHNLGNHLVRALIDLLFNCSLRDIMSGYRAFNRKFVKTMPVLSSGFEIETEMTIHALDKRFLVKEVPINYRDRPAGSLSKLGTLRDGVKVIKTIFTLFKDYRPLLFFSVLSGILFCLGLLIGVPVISEFMNTHFVTKVPSAILAVGFIVLSTLLATCGLILDTIVKQHRATYALIMTRYMMQYPESQSSTQLSTDENIPGVLLT